MEGGVQKSPIENLGTNGLSNVEIFISDASLERPTVSLLERTVKFADSTSQLLGEEFIRLYRQDREKAIGNPNPASLNFLRQRGHHLPRFTLFDHSTSDEFISQTPFPEESIQCGNLLLVFNFPPLITRQNYRKHVEDISGNSVIGWNAFEFPLRKKIRKNVEKFQESGKLEFERVNDFGEHDSSLFYYVWEVAFPETSFHTVHHNGH